MKTIPILTVNKNLLQKNAVNGFIQSHVTIPLVQEKNACLECIVRVGDTVQEGQVIALPTNNSSNNYEANVHASVPGIVEDIVSINCPNGKKEDAVRIKLSGSFSFLGKEQKVQDWNFFSPNYLLQKFSEAGIINTFEANNALSLAAEIGQKQHDKNRLLVVRLYDNDAYCVTSELLTHWFFDNVIEGSLICAKALDAQGIVFVAGKKIDISSVSDKKLPVCLVQTDNTRYPFGFKQNIISEVRRTTKELPFSEISENSLYTDSSTMLEVYTAMVKGLPCIEKYVYVDGDCLPVSGLIKTRIGTTIEYIASQCGTFKMPAETVVINGMMNGKATTLYDTPITKYVKSLTFLSKSNIRGQKQSLCTRCGQCRYVCPCHICPDVIYRAVGSNIKVEDEYIKSSVLCYDCAMCNAVCPSHLPINQAIKLVKSQFQNRV
ncbi:MAG: hypothetical protein IJR49_05155 [Treponema sp.]|nr:hypothetical protein [Treponema sp.]